MSPHPLTEKFARKHPARRVDSLLKMVGNTPLVQLRHVVADLPETVEIWVKLEYVNPGGSIKDRAARQIIMEARERGELNDKILIDATSGNTGIGYAMLGASLGVSVELVMPENTSEARKHIVRTLGATITYSSASEGTDGAIRLVREMLQKDREGEQKYFYADQYGNPSNPRAHELTTAREIWKQTDGRVTHFLAATGTSGTLMGTSRGLKALSPDVYVVGCQPSSATHGLEGLKHMASSIVPAIYNEEELDSVVFVETQDGLDMAKRLATEEGIAAGNSAGANVHAALELAKTLESGVIVTVICDHADRYLGD